MRFTQAYAASPVCSPTRASIVTGKHPARLDITDWIPGNPRKGKLDRLRFTEALPLEEVTIAEALKEAGYRTGHIGKWHLGKEGFLPEQQGYDVNVAGNHRGSPHMGYFAPWRMPNLTEGERGDYLPDRLADEAIRFMEASKDKPFYLQLCHYTVHSPVQGEPHLVKKYEAKAQELPAHEGPLFTNEKGDAMNREVQDHAGFAAMVEAMDRNVGRVLEALKRLKLAEHTVVVFFSDNGGQSILPKGASPAGLGARTAPCGPGRAGTTRAGSGYPSSCAGPARPGRARPRTRP